MIQVSSEILTFSQRKSPVETQRRSASTADHCRCMFVHVLPRGHANFHAPMVTVLWWTLPFAPISVALTMSRTVDVDAQISQQMVAMWGATDDTPPEELDPREVWWRDRYQQLSNHGYLLRPRYSPQWAPSWRSSNRNWTDSEDSRRLKV